MPFRGIISGKACNLQIILRQAGFSAVKSVLQKGLPFCRIFREKPKLSANYPVESFSILQKVKISLFKGVSLLLKLIFDKNSTMGDRYYPRFGRKNRKTWDNWERYFDFPQIICGKSNFMHEYLREFEKKYVYINIF
jgi:hypothetical protein